ncbi:hypothetical protein AAG906_016981 [Vitis piasezkii]
MPWSICRSYEHLVDECPTIPTVKEMFGDCNTYNSNWRDHPNFSWKPQPPQYQQPAQAPQQASNLHQAMVNLSKVVGDFVGAQKSINAQLTVKELTCKEFANLNTVQEKETLILNLIKIPMVSMKWKLKGESSMVKEVEVVITLRSGKEPHPHFATVGHIFGALPGAQIIHTICHFKSWEVRSPMLQTVLDLELKRRSYVRLKTSAKSQSGNFAAETPFGRVFRSCKTTLWHTSATLQHPRPFRSCKMGCENSPPPQNPPPAAKMLQASKWAAKISHTKPLTPFLTSLKPSRPIAPAEETMPPKETTKAKVKVLIQPTQEATTDASAPQDPTIT